MPPDQINFIKFVEVQSFCFSEKFQFRKSKCRYESNTMYYTSLKYRNVQYSMTYYLMRYSYTYVLNIHG